MCYFTISEFAKLRNVNINSLRYYEKIGILKPDHINEKNGYRYYSPDQLPILDVILLCLDFGMPLKNLKSCISDGKFINNIKLFELGKEIAEERLRNAQAEQNKIEYTIKYLQSNQQYSNIKGLYEREIPDRTIMSMEYTGDLTDISKIEMTSAKLYAYAQEKKVSPVFPAGLLIKKTGDKLNVKVFLEIMDKTANDPLAEVLPGGTFLCHKIDMTPNMDLPKTIENAYNGESFNSIILANILLDKFQIGTKKSELQKRLTTLTYSHF